MGQRCGCVSKDCNCGIVGTDTVFIQSGVGTEVNPYILSRSSHAFLQGGNDGGQFTITGSGTATSPYDLSINLPSSSGRRPTSTVFTSNGTWTKPTGIQLFQVTLIGGGGGGGAGMTVAFAGPVYFNYAGMGGDGGAVNRFYVHLSSAYTSAEVVVGAGGAGGTVDPSTPSQGTFGVGWPSSGGVTYVRFMGAGQPTREYAAVGGRGGLTGLDSGAQYREPIGWANTGAGMWTGQKAHEAGQGSGPVLGISAGAGGPGNWQGGFPGGAHSLYDGKTNGTIWAGGDGGAGGSASPTTGLPGGAGYKYGAGGGGGGSTSDAFYYNGGAGGNGAPGLVVITEL